jgi:hypothetical protein
LLLCCGLLFFFILIYPTKSHTKQALKTRNI